MNWTRLRVNGNRVFLKKEFVFLIFLFTVLTLVTGGLLYEVYLNDSSKDTRGIFADTVLNMTNTYNYTYMIKEETDEYNLEFAGLVVNPDKIIGNFREYNLDVYKVADNLFIKNPLQGEWEMVNEIELEDLINFIQSPSDILEQVIMEWTEPAKITSKIVNEKEYLLIIYSPSPQEKEEFILNYYPHLALYEEVLLNCNVWVTAEEPFLHKMEFIISLEDSDGKTEIIRRELLINQEQEEQDTSEILTEEV
ncbi:hypothetical protein [Candidatus Contubernalis alkaliaceticus]|uniref:hypothetical protein n=1 Tax=Candidatus Contubernalis alkaliaceticus TaxID=338645 RepID=UPI001F4BD31B|nr:hypothetical protein [Candidatus Contubernalis alkalaceticus]UNC92434.1 hypothetical protein HUE98_10175 [Candidatus Contubernalis alkalaceticus]